MSGIITSNKFIIGFKDGGGIKHHALLTYNTKNFFRNRLCLCLKKGNRILYIPSVSADATTTIKTTVNYDPYTAKPTITKDYVPIDFSKSFGYKKNNTMYYFLTDANGTAETARITIEGQWSNNRDFFVVGYLKIKAYGNFAGIDYNFIIKDIGDAPFFSDLNISAGEEATFNINLYTRNALIYYNSKFEIECECSDTQKKTTRAYEVYENTTYFKDEYEFSLKE